MMMAEQLKGKEIVRIQTRDDDSGNNGDDLDTTIPSLLPFP